MNLALPSPPAGPVTLSELFGTSNNLVVYHLMFDSEWAKACSVRPCVCVRVVVVSNSVYAGLVWEGVCVPCAARVSVTVCD